MEFSESDFYKTFKKYEKFIMAVNGILIVILLIMIWSLVYKDTLLKKEISLNCGWGDEDYYCYCEKDEAMTIKNRIENIEDEFKLELENLRNVSVDWRSDKKSIN